MFLLNLRTYFTNSGPSYLSFITSFPSIVNVNRSLTCSFHPATSLKGLQESISRFNPLRCGFKPYIYWCNESINHSMTLAFVMVVFYCSCDISSTNVIAVLIIPLVIRYHPLDIPTIMNDWTLPGPYFNMVIFVSSMELEPLKVAL